MDSSSTGLRLTAYRTGDTSGWSLEPSPAKRAWMDEFPDKGPYRCLPMTIANQAGWVVRGPASFTATWNGGGRADATSIVMDPGHEAFAGRVVSHFGRGVVTFHLPWLFRTSPGWALLVRGPSNDARLNAAPLEGLVETDWAPYPFTMNWRLLRPNAPGRFERGDVVCMLIPVSLDALERFETAERDLREDPELEGAFRAFKAARAQGISTYLEGNRVVQGMYAGGRTPDGAAAERHRATLRLTAFGKAPAPDAQPDA